MQISIRPLQLADAAIYRALRLKSFKEEPFAFSESYEDEIHRTVEDFALELEINDAPTESFVLGAFHGDALLGFVRFRRDTRSKAMHKAMVHGMYVSAECRYSGVGKKLIQALVDKARHMQGLEQVHLWVLHATGSVSGFYSSCGFTSQGTRVQKDLKVNGTYVDAEYMVMYLD